MAAPFSRLSKQALGQWSPDGRHLAGAAESRLLVRDGLSLRLVQCYVCAERLRSVEWAPDSEHLLTTSAQPGVVQIWSLRDADWACRIDEGIAGVAHACWGPSSLHVLVVNDFQLRLKVWSISDRRAVAQVSHPKYSSRGLAFDREGRWLALLRRSQCQDSLEVLDCREGFAQVAHAALPPGADVANLQWTAGGRAILLWERPSRGPRLLWYSLQGRALGQVDECKLMRNVFLSPSLEFAAVGSFDGSLHLVNTVAMTVLSQFAHDLKAACMETDESEVAVFREELADQPPASEARVRYARLPSPSAARLPAERPGAEPGVDAEGVPRQGVGLAVWSPDERYVATQHDGMPTAVWIWDLGRMALAALLIHRTPVRCFAWDPCGGRRGCHPRLVLATAVDPLLFVWSPAGAQARVVPSPIPAVRLRWRCDGRALLLQEPERACVCQLPEEQQDEEVEADTVTGSAREE